MMAIAARFTAPTAQGARSFPRQFAHAIDRWIFVFMAASFVAITLAGFIPDSLEKIAAVQSHARAPFPAILHVHAVLMASFLLLLLAQTSLAATGNISWHKRLGAMVAVVVPALVVVGFLLVPVIYHAAVEAVQHAAPSARGKLLANLARRENVLLMQLRMGALFPVLLAIGLAARKRDAGLHKRMMILATVVVLPPSIDRIAWLPGTFPQSMWSTEAYIVLAIAPMLLWDVLRTHSVHRAYIIWIAVSLPFVAVLHTLWDTPWWHATAHHLLAG